MYMTCPWVIQLYRKLPACKRGDGMLCTVMVVSGFTEARREKAGSSAESLSAYTPNNGICTPLQELMLCNSGRIGSASAP